MGLSSGLCISTPVLGNARPNPAAILGASNIAFDLSAKSIATLYQNTALTIGVSAFGQSVAGWFDTGVLAAHMLQATAGLRPTYQNGAGGRPVVRFDGAGSFLQSSFHDLAPSPLTIWAVLSATPGAAGVHDTLWDGQNVDKCQFLIQNTPQTVLWAGAGLTFAGVVCNGAFEAICCVYDPVAGKLYQNNILRAGGSTGGNTPTWGTIGARPDGTQSAAFDLAHIIGFRGSPTGPQGDAMQNFLAGEWNL